MDIVLGLSIASTTIRMVLLEGVNADGVTVDEDAFEMSPSGDSATSATAERVLATIVGAREGAAEGGCRLLSTGVAWTNSAQAAALRDALAARKAGNVMLVSAFLAAATLTQNVGQALGYDHTAMLFLEPQNATLGVVDSADGSIADVRKEPVHCARYDAEAVARLAAMIAGLNALGSQPQGIFVVGCGVDVGRIKPALEAATPLPVSAPEEPEMALARGAALASANAPLFACSTAGLAYSQDPGSGAVDRYGIAGYVRVSRRFRGMCADGSLGDNPLAYTALPDEEADADTVVLNTLAHDGVGETRNRRWPVLLVSAGLAAFFAAGIVALVVSVTIGIRPTVALPPRPDQNRIIPVGQAPAPAPKVQEPSVPPAAAAPPEPVAADDAQSPAVSAPAAPVAADAPIPPLGVPAVPPQGPARPPRIHLPVPAAPPVPPMSVPAPPRILAVPATPPVPVMGSVVPRITALLPHFGS